MFISINYRYFSIIRGIQFILIFITKLYLLCMYGIIWQNVIQLNLICNLRELNLFKYRQNS